MRIFLKIIISIIGIILIVSMFYIGYSNYLENKIEKLYKEKEDILSTYNIPLKNKGTAWIDKSMMGDNLGVFGSSELDSIVGQNIKYNFPNDKYEGNISCIGEAHVQNMLHSINLGANYKSFKGKNLVVIESMQWFYDKDKKTDAFMAKFSDLQFYEFMQNDLISDKNKNYLCKRFLDLESKRMLELRDKDKDADFEYPRVHILAALYSSDKKVDRFIYHLMRPYYYSEYKILSLKDKNNTYKYFRDLIDNYDKPMFVTDWVKQLDEATKQGMASCTNNDLLVYDEYYNKYLRDGWGSLKDSKKDMPLLESKEWEDYKFLLSVCKDLKIKPLIINVSCNPRYYNYIGITLDKRRPYYNRISDVAKENGFTVYNGLIERENEPYLFQDVMHLGWKGWIYLTEEITTYFEKIDNNKMGEENAI